MITLTVGFSRNPRLEPLFQGAVKPQNIDLQFVYCPPGDLFYRNLRDGTVEVVSQGPDDALDRLEQALRRGPSGGGARVDAVEQLDVPAELEVPKSFDIK